MTLDSIKTEKQLAYGRINAANCHELLNCLSALNVMIELIEDHGWPMAKFEAAIDKTIAKINRILLGDLSKMKSKTHQFPSWVLVIGD